ncbi:hypothetical protein PROFUN_02691 [Planoprotostelium fungivorum]|uniref:Uncharacterized protein n=1 Tax=Planoprotostelium fungivorum TaxID=1890364 RepID=A0A2P6NVF6_9EUKA|nr:hypothetical protein PROFUN_02691 [Planoprotostelium fungivorum]
MQKSLVFTFFLSAVAFSIDCDVPQEYKPYKSGEFLGTLQSNDVQIFFTFFNNTADRRVQIYSESTSVVTSTYLARPLPQDSKVLFASILPTDSQHQGAIQMFFIQQNQVLMLDLHNNYFYSSVDIGVLIPEDLALLHDQNYQHDPMLAVAGQDRHSGEHVVLVFKLDARGLPKLHARFSAPRTSRHPAPCEISGGQYNPQGPSTFSKSGFYVSLLIDGSQIYTYNCVDGQDGQKCTNFEVVELDLGKSITKGSLFSTVEINSTEVVVGYQSGIQSYMMLCRHRRCTSVDDGIRVNSLRLSSFYSHGKMYHYVVTLDDKTYVMTCADVRCKTILSQDYLKDEVVGWGGDIAWGAGMDEEKQQVYIILSDQMLLMLAVTVRLTEGFFDAIHTRLLSVAMSNPEIEMSITDNNIDSIMSFDIEESLEMDRGLRELSDMIRLPPLKKVPRILQRKRPTKKMKLCDEQTEAEEIQSQLIYEMINENENSESEDANKENEENQSHHTQIQSLDDDTHTLNHQEAPKKKKIIRLTEKRKDILEQAYRRERTWTDAEMQYLEEMTSMNRKQLFYWRVKRARRAKDEEEFERYMAKTTQPPVFRRLS